MNIERRTEKDLQKETDIRTSDSQTEIKRGIDCKKKTTIEREAVKKTGRGINIIIFAYFPVENKQMN